MKKNNISPIQIDPITGEYQITIPEWIMTELGWYEDTEISMIIEGSELVLAEK
jgi:bifunctional DNA-binding transcriptional regulator/antitoxin component of YhaV-PrlF toxin-antitoxin module